MIKAKSKALVLLLGLSSVLLAGCSQTSKSYSNSSAQPASEKKLRVATWNVEHLAFPADIGCKPRSASDIEAMKDYAQNVDVDIFALQEVHSEQAVRLLFPRENWQVFMSARPDSEAYECRGSGRQSTQQKIAYAVRNNIKVKALESLSEFALERPGLRFGLELTVGTDFGDVSFLNVHMKSGCFVDNYSRSDSDACQTFAQQAPILDGWIEEKEKTNQTYVVLGDFNHRLTAPYNHLTQALFTNSDGSTSSLVNTTANLIGCHPYYPAPIDLIFVGGMKDEPVSFSIDAHRFNNMNPDDMLSDHCAVSVDITSS